jgi:hypothetical protein
VNSAPGGSVLISSIVAGLPELGGVHVHGSKDKYLRPCLGGKHLRNCLAAINHCDLIITQADLTLKEGARFPRRLPSANEGP